VVERKPIGATMRTLHTPGFMKKFKRTQWRFQQTFQTPLNDLDRFVEMILSTVEPRAALLTIDEYVFVPVHVPALFTVDVRQQLAHDWSIEADSSDTARLLRASFDDWLDFLFVPEPKPFVIYADHDEYATFYANSKSNLNSVVLPLERAGFIMVHDWQRTF
jgi:hypothetical protein